MYLIGLNFHGFFTVVFDCSFLDSALLYFYQKHMAFRPQSQPSSFSFERDFKYLWQINRNLSQTITFFFPSYVKSQVGRKILSLESRKLNNFHLGILQCDEKGNFRNFGVKMQDQINPIFDIYTTLRI